MPRSLFTRLLHAAIALAVVAQLVGIGLAEPPSHGAPGNLAFSVHQVVGLGTLGVLGLGQDAEAKTCKKKCKHNCKNSRKGKTNKQCRNHCQRKCKNRNN